MNTKNKKKLIRFSEDKGNYTSSLNQIITFLQEIIFSGNKNFLIEVTVVPDEDFISE